MSFPLDPVLAYIGPGAGFAFLGSFLSILGGVLLGLISFLLWPVRMVWGSLTGRQGYKNAKVKKLIFLGLDGLDPGLAERYMKEGKLPNLSRLREQGGFTRLLPDLWSPNVRLLGNRSAFVGRGRCLRCYRPDRRSQRRSRW